MDILVSDRSPRHRTFDEAPPGEAKLWGLVAGAFVLGMLFLVGAFDRGNRLQVASGEPVPMQQAPAPLMPESPLP